MTLCVCVSCAEQEILIKLTDSQARRDPHFSSKSDRRYVKKNNGINNNNNKNHRIFLHTTTLHLRKDVIFDFKRFVLARHGMLWSSLGEEVSNALEFYMVSAKDIANTRHTNTKIVKIHPSTQKKHTAIAEKLSVIGSFPKINNDILKREIKQVLEPCDARTLRKYYDQVRSLCSEDPTEFGGIVYDVTEYVRRFTP